MSNTLMSKTLSKINQQYTKITLALAVIMVSVAPASAGTDTTFSAFVNKAESWITGSLGIVIILGFLVFSIFQFFRNGVSAALLPLGAALVLALGVPVLKGIFTATIMF